MPIAQPEAQDAISLILYVEFAEGIYSEPLLDQLAGLQEAVPAGTTRGSASFTLPAGGPTVGDWTDLKPWIEAVQRGRTGHRIQHVDLLLALEAMESDLACTFPPSVLALSSFVDEVWIDAQSQASGTGTADGIRIMTDCDSSSRLISAIESSDAEERQRGFVSGVQRAMSEMQERCCIGVELMPLWGRAGIIMDREMMTAIAKKHASITFRIST